MTALERSLQTDGWIGAITVAADGETFDGSARIEVGAATGFDDAIVVESDGTRPIIHVRTDIPTAGDVRAVRLGLAANRVAELNLGWDAAVLADLGTEIDLSQFWTRDELAALLVQDVTAGGGDEAPAVEDGPTRVQPGELWRLGEHHRLLCGDSTKREDVERLMGGERAALAWFDPPFGIDLQPQRGLTDAIANDSNAAARDLWAAFLPLLVDHLAEPATAFLCQDWTEFEWTIPLIRRWLTLKGKVVWHKAQWGIGYYMRPQHEDVLYCWKGVPARPDQAISDVWEHARPSAPEHAAEKPVGLSQQAIEFASKRGDVVIDWFAGVGGSLIAAHRTARQWRGLELDPKYADVILKRYEAETGDTAERVT